MTDNHFDRTAPLSGDFRRNGRHVRPQAIAARTVKPFAAIEHEWSSTRAAAHRSSGAVVQAEFYAWVGLALCVFAAAALAITVVVLS